MKKATRIILSLFIAVACLIVIPLLLNEDGNNETTTAIKVPAKLTQRSNPYTICHALENGKEPDPKCTPGVTDPRVTQANIRKTICVSGYTSTVRPSASYTNALKKKQILEYGYTDTNIHDYEEDHLISLELGGSPKDPKNLWPELGVSPNPKDKIENLLHKRVCNDALTLSQAQQIISHDWDGIQ